MEFWESIPGLLQRFTNSDSYRCTLTRDSRQNYEVAGKTVSYYRTSKHLEVDKQYFEDPYRSNSPEGSEAKYY
jgi:hypothetical protein